MGCVPGRLTPKLSAKGVCAAPDYKAMYLALFRANEQAVRLLLEAQQRAEQQLLEESPPPLHLDTEKPDLFVKDFPDRETDKDDRR